MSDCMTKRQTFPDMPDSGQRPRKHWLVVLGSDPPQRPTGHTGSSDENHHVHHVFVSCASGVKKNLCSHAYHILQILAYIQYISSTFFHVFFQMSGCSLPGRIKWQTAQNTLSFSLNMTPNQQETPIFTTFQSTIYLTLYDMLLVRCFYPKRLTYSILRTTPTGAIWGEVSCPGTQRHADCSGV